MKKLLRALPFAFLVGCAATPQDDNLAAVPEKCEVLGSNIPKKAGKCPDQTVSVQAVRARAESVGAPQPNQVGR
jgi:hypothetical protein